MRIDEVIKHGGKRLLRAEVVRLLKKSDPRTTNDFNKIVRHALDNYKRVYGPFDDVAEDDQLTGEMMAYAQQANRQIPRNTGQPTAKQKLINSISELANISKEELEMLPIDELFALKKEYSQ